jgi:hypothetical protein
VASRQEWRHVYYRLAGPDIEQLLADVDRVLSALADRIAACGRPEMGGGDER